jgi:hypothetical protein
MSQKSTTTSTTPQQQFVTSSEKREDIIYSSLLGGIDDETGSRNGDDSTQRMLNEKRDSILGRARGKSTLKSPYGAHKGIGINDAIAEGHDQLDKLNNWGEFQNLLDYIKEQKAQHRIEARKVRADKQHVEPSPYASYPAEARDSWFKKQRNQVYS